MKATRSTRRDLWSFDRSDRWGLALFLALIALGTLALQILAPLVGWARSAGLQIDYVGPVRVPALDDAGVAHDGLGSVGATIADPSATQRFVDLMPGLVVTPVIVVACWLVFAIMRDVASGDPFRPRNVTRLRVLAVLVAIGLPVAWFARMSADFWLLASLNLRAGAAGVTFDVPWALILVGSVIALTAEAFSAGTRLREDTEGLV